MKVKSLIERPLEGTIFAARWLQAPLYVGLIVALVLYCIMFYVELIHLCKRVAGIPTDHEVAEGFDTGADSHRAEPKKEEGKEEAKEAHKGPAKHQGMHITEEELMLAVLTMVDVTMVANLIVMVVVGGYATFVSKLDFGDDQDRPDWLDHINAASLKIKLSASLVSISGIHLLKAFINIDQMKQEHVMWMVVIHMVFLLSAFILSLSERVLNGPNVHHAPAGHGPAGNGHPEDAHGKDAAKTEGHSSH
jgi:uncharacterized protein (TIGR00645 family)